ncbi:MAG: four-carbon acid sugar kinase family protein [Lacisediminihabitans sp.]
MSEQTLPSVVRDAEELLSAGPPVLRIQDSRLRIREANEASNTWVVVLDDDPTGSQSVQGVPVLTRWNSQDLRWAFAQPARAFFVLTNTRGLNDREARSTVRGVAQSIKRAASELGAHYVLITRSDSTLRGHFPLETDVLAEMARSSGQPYDALLIAPAYIEAARLTEGDVHYVRAGDSFVPVGQTNYARDATFGFVSSNLRDYVQEKTNALVSSSDVVSLSLEDIRRGGPARVRDVILACKNATPVIVNAIDEADLDVVVLGLVQAEEAGARVLCRTGPSFVAARVGLNGRASLSHEEVFAAGERRGNGLVVVGSHVELTTQQVARLTEELTDIEIVELDVPKLLDPARSVHEIARCGNALVAALEGADTVLVSSRQQIVGDTGYSSLVIAQTVSQALVALTARAVDEVPVRWVMAKGGITSSDIATGGLGIRRATVVGQLFPGIVSVWVHEGGNGRGLKGLPYVVFAGNVGDESTLADAVKILRGPHNAS